jgi:pimeloyl-ACP methyl ester carboxylesterase
MTIEETELGAVQVTGPDDAKPVVFVHASIFNRTMWAPQREALAGQFRVITPELPGHGTRADEQFRLEAAIDTLGRAIEEIAEESVHLVGLSLGGYVATMFARRQPEAVDHLVVSSSSANPVDRLGTITRLLGKATLLASRSGLVERAAGWVMKKYVGSRDLRPDLEREIVDAGFDLESFGEAGLEIADEDFRSAFASFPGPALVLNGKWDLVMRLGERAHAEAGDATAIAIKGAGHVCNLDQPDVYSDQIERFVEPVRMVDADD